MPDTTPVKLPTHWQTFVETQVASGRYANPDDVIQAGLRLLEEQDAKLEQLRADLIDGEESGDAEPFSMAEFRAQLRAEHARRP